MTVANCPTCHGTGLEVVPGDLARMCATCMNGSHDAAPADPSSRPGHGAQDPETRVLGAADDSRIPAIRCGIEWAIWRAVDGGLGGLAVGFDWHAMSEDDLIVIAARALEELQRHSLEAAA